MTYLKIEEDKTHIEVHSVLNYLKLRKIKRMILENQIDLEKKHTPEEKELLVMTHEHLIQIETELIQVHKHIKEMEMEMVKISGTVIAK